ncbi:ATP-dependent exoDNAse (exonuclease V) beta subunit (contains helicase and exonuclease domains) [Cyclobacterium lianum]|uniref:DNA 3'-5' helicase n=2 Tax=Cyclobacterium lianum TaxID=388280 RepID=A0A1M7QS22_9BACT|nr:ATP-dependent exoDNAse (exonuclease V) beta subunit (contains helicase and exonuclease domains) [Cyclobacterium lianum]
MQMAPFQIFKSSAGSGKTYTLTTAYLKLALEHPLAFRQVLAVTFTNKATQEMKERIIQELKRIKEGVDPDQQMDRDLLEKWQLSPQELSQRASGVLRAILHDYSAFSVSTIDSFFQRVIRAFAREIDLQAKFDIEMDQEAVMSRLVDRLMLRAAEDPALHRWMVNFSIAKITEGKSWDIRKPIHDLGKKIFEEDFKVVQQEVRAFLAAPENMQQFRKHLYQQKKLLGDQAREMKEKAGQIRERHGLVWEDFAGGSMSFARLFDKLGDPRKPIPTLTDAQKKKIGNPESWATKSSKMKAAIHAAYQEGLGDMLAEIESLEKTWTTLEVIYKNLYVFGLFGYLLEELEGLKAEENVLLISETNDFLRSITAGNEAPFIYEKVGNQFHHFLLDEFQDTSGFQWASFRPLLINSLAMGKSNLIVGDVKQSIYRWRGGEMRLLMEQVEQDAGHFGVAVRQLATNYRSLPQLVYFNNSLFRQMSGILADHLSATPDPAPGGIIREAYAEISQQVAPHQERRGITGKVKLDFILPETDRSYAEVALEMLPGQVAQLLARGYRLQDIAILVRKNGQAAAVVDAFMLHGEQDPYQKYEVLSDEALYLNRSAVIKCLLAALKVVNDPDDKLAASSIWIHWARVWDRDIQAELFQHGYLPGSIQQLSNKFTQQLPEFRRLALMDLLEAIIDLLGFNEDVPEKAYLSGLKEAFYDFGDKNRADLGNFLDWWEQQGHRRTVKLPEEHDAIRILTIHKAKGLQFKVVLLPFLDWKLFDTTKDNVVWTAYDWEENGQRVNIPLTIRNDLMKSAFSPIFLKESLLHHLDNLNMLYVAFTRAEEVIWGMAPFRESKGNGTLKTVADLLLQAVSFPSPVQLELDLCSHFDREKLVFDMGDWHQSERMAESLEGDQPMAWKYRPWVRNLQVRDLFGSFEGSGLFRKRDFGLLVHSLIERSRSREDFMLELDSLYYEGGIDAGEKDSLAAQFDELCRLEKFSSWFDGSNTVYTEQGILLPGGESKRPDRLVYLGDRIEVVDFKTGREQKTHHKQVRGYVDLVRQMERDLVVEGYLCYLESGLISKVN